MWFRTIFRREPASETEADGPTGVQAFELSGRLFTRLNRLRLASTRRLRGAGAGQRPSARRRPAADFREHRQYVAGDDIRFVDWNASARSEQVFLKQGEQPQETTVHLLVDTSASMAWGEPPKHAAVLPLAAALGYLALNGDDRLHLVPLLTEGGTAAGPVDRPFKGKGQFPTLWKTLQGLRFDGRSRLLPTVRRLVQTSRGGIVLVLSDLLEEDELDKALALLPRPAWEAYVLHTLHPAELEPALLGEFELVDSETGRRAGYDVDAPALDAYRARLDRWRGDVERVCIRHSVLYTLVSTGWSLERESVPHLLGLRVLEPV
ncbi:MAG TPA: DUF58 domain-containing protein [Anaerolineales bacterium]|nr:DUF58 domain-containing protein [Anaerolineales bacterium]